MGAERGGKPQRRRRKNVRQRGHTGCRTICVMMTRPDSIEEAAADGADEIIEITDEMIVEVWAEGGEQERGTPPPLPTPAARRAGPPSRRRRRRGPGSPPAARRADGRQH